MLTRLMYLNLDKATKPLKVGRYWLQPALSRRYQNVLAREFRKVGLPFIALPPKDDSKNPRHQRPKGDEFKLYEKALRQQKIMHNLAKADEEVTKYRQDMLNKRPYRGFDRLLKEALPEWSVMLREEAMESASKPGEEDED